MEVAAHTQRRMELFNSFQDFVGCIETIREPMIECEIIVCSLYFPAIPVDFLRLLNVCG